MRANKLPAMLRFLLPASCWALGGLLLLAACSGGSDEGATAGQPTTPAKAAQPPAQTPATPAPSAPGKTSAPSSQASLDACSLLTKQEVEAAIGQTVLEPRADALGTIVSCEYGDPDHPDFHFVSVGILVGEDKEDAEFAYELGKRNNAGQLKTVGGLGDDAYWIELFGSLEILKGKYDISIGVAPDASEDDDRESIAKGLAAKVLARLP